MTGFKQEGDYQERRKKIKIKWRKNSKSYIAYDFENNIIRINIDPCDDTIAIFQSAIRAFKEHNYFK